MAGQEPLPIDAHELVQRLRSLRERADELRGRL
jgi:hypothetical protein